MGVFSDNYKNGKNGKNEISHGVYRGQKKGRAVKNGPTNVTVQRNRATPSLHPHAIAWNK
jgi:hypothetical protein